MSEHNAALRARFDIILRGRGYDNHAADDAIFQELLDDLVTEAAHFPATPAELARELSLPLRALEGHLMDAGRYSSQIQRALSRAAARDE